MGIKYNDKGRIMASKYWIKLYHEILDDPKMGKMPDRLWRRTIELFLIAGEFDQDGTLPTPEDISWRLRLTENETLDDMNYLVLVGILTEENNVYTVSKFIDRQSAMSGAERIKRFRETKRKDEYYSRSNDVSNDNVTNRSQIRLDKNRLEEDIEQDYISAFCEITGLALSGNVSTHAKWTMEVAEWIPMSIQYDDIIDAYNLAIEKGYTVSRPGGLTSFLRGNVAKNNAKHADKKTYIGPDGEEIVI